MNASLNDIFYIEKLHSEKAKLLASEISNETARRILKELYNNPSSITDLSNKLDIPASTVQYHINKLMELGVIKVAKNRLGKRLRDVKMYTYNKEGIVFLSSMEGQDFINLMKKIVLHRLKINAPALFMISTIFGLIFAFIGSLIVKECLKSVIISSRHLAEGAGGVNLSFVLLIMLALYLLGITTSLLLISLTVKKY